MKVKAGKLLLRGLGVGLVLAGATVFWMQERRDASQEVAGIAPDRVEDSAERVAGEEIESLKAEIKRLKDGRTDLERLSAKMNHELGSLRSQITQLNQEQRSIVRDIDQMASAGLEGSKEAPGEAAPELTSEEELERTEAQIQAQIELLDQTLIAEQTDPGWASSAQLALDQALRNEEMKGLTLVGKECRATMCRLELQLDGSALPEKGSDHLAYLSPWRGPGFFWIDNTGHAVVYLAREGYSLPQSQ